MKVRIPYQMNSSAKNAMMAEINRQILESDKEFSIEFDAMILWTLHIIYGFGEKRLKRFWDGFAKEHQRLRDRYQFEPEDDGWLYRYLLKEHTGIDLEKWYQEQEQRGDKNNGKSVL